MADLVPAEGRILEHILDATHVIWHDGLDAASYRRYNQAQLATTWGRAHIRRLALVDGDEVLASAKEYVFDATLDGRAVRVLGLGAVFTQPVHRGRGVARDLIERLLQRAAAEGTGLALLFSEIGPDYYARLGFEQIPTVDYELRLAGPVRHGAPATMVRAGEPRDLPAIAAMGSTRAAGSRFHLDRDADLIQYAISKKRLLAGLSPAGARELLFFIAEEGITAAAYVVVSASGGEWTINECGDRDPTGARVGAILQLLVARDPVGRRPVIRGRLPFDFCPPPVTIVDERPSSEVMMIRALGADVRKAPPLQQEDVLYWHGDLF